MTIQQRSRITRFPQKSIWRQFNFGELFGDIWGSFNLDLISNKGKVRVAPPANALFTNADSSAMIYPVGAKKSQALAGDGSTYRWWVLCDVHLYYGDTSGNFSTITEDATANTPTTSHLVSDIEDAFSNLYVSLSTDIAQLSAGTWIPDWWHGADDLNQPSLGANPHPLHLSFNNLLCIGDGNILHTVDSGSNVDTGGGSGYRLKLKPELQIVWIRSSRSAIWIGCRNVRGGPAEVIQWDGGSQSFNNNYKLNSSECYSGIVKDDVPYIVIGTGEFQQFNGRGFVTIDSFPIFMNKDHVWQDTWTIPNLVHRNGMAIIDGNINILANAALDANGGFSTEKTIENFRSGIWEYTKETGLYHKFGINKTKTGGNTDFGSPFILKPGFLVANSPNVSTTTKFYYGAAVYANDGIGSTTITHVLGNLSSDTSTNKKMGWLITPQIQTSEVEEVWQTIWLLSKKFANSTSNIYIKYRLDLFSFDASNTFDEGQGNGPVWSTTTALNINTTNFPDAANVQAGDEVEIMSGVGAGTVATVLIAGAPIGGVATFTIDQTVTGATNQNINVRFSRWVKIDNWQDQVQRYRRIPINQASTFIQFKLVIFALNTSPELEKIRLRSEAKRLT